MIDLLILRLCVRGDDDSVFSDIEVVDTREKHSNTRVRVREFVRGAPNGFYKTWLFEDRCAAVSHALELAGFGPLKDDEC